MSFGRPPSSLSSIALGPPDRGSFPLDHDGECTAAMRAYMACLKQAKGDNGACRELSQRYLECRMDQ
jgi:cytochrome c oxidase assembly protein subunit 19